MESRTVFLWPLEGVPRGTIPASQRLAGITSTSFPSSLSRFGRVVVQIHTNDERRINEAKNGSGWNGEALMTPRAPSPCNQGILSFNFAWTSLYRHARESFLRRWGH